MKLFLLLTASLLLGPVKAQEHAWVYFTDKPNVAQSLSNPISILTQRAIDRKNAHNVVIDERDVPVNETYIASLKNQTGITVRAKSKWFNNAHVIGSVANINALTALSFVERVVFANNALNPGSKPSKTVAYRPTDKLNAQIEFTYGNTANQVQQINIDALHALDYTGEGLIIAVLDSGFPNVNTMGAFQRLRDNGDLLNGYDFVDRNPNVYAYTANSHGTLVLSTMAGFVNNQFVGTAPDASYYLFRTEDAGSETPVEESYWVEAAERADSLGVDIINTSLGYNTFDNAGYDYSTSDMDGNTAFISQGANVAIEKGILVVTSAGNAGNDPAWGIITAPADANVLTVGAVNASGNYASFSSRGPSADMRVKPDVVAQGSGSAVITSSNVIATANGTSFSSPIMAGAVACLWQAFPARTNLEIMQLVREASSRFLAPTIQLGYGIPNFEDALNLALNTEEPSVQNEFKVFPNPTTGRFRVLMPTGTNSAVIELYDVLGKRVLRKEISSTNSSIDIGPLQKGVYIAQIASGSNKKTLKIVKQ